MAPSKKAVLPRDFEKNVAAQIQDQVGTRSRGTGRNKRPSRGRETPSLPEGANLWKSRIKAALMTIVGPTLLIYVNLRCEKNQCVLYQLPLVLPTHPGAYISFKAISLVIGFFLLMFFLNVALSQSSGKAKDAGIYSLLSATLLMLGLAYVRPDLIHSAHAEYLRLLVCATFLCVAFSAVLATIAWFNYNDRDPHLSWGCLFFRGTQKKLMLGPVELKYFFYVNIGLVAWALLDVLLLLNFSLKASLTPPMIFLATTQYFVIAHTLLYENFLTTKPFVDGDRLGFYWLLKVVLYLPFLHSLPVHYAAVTDIMLPKPAMLADWVLFLFGFIIYASSIHQKENFVEDPASFKGWKSLAVPGGGRLLTSGYWGMVQKPDYFGYMIIWMSWVFACGLSGLSLLVLGIIYMTIWNWCKKVAKLNHDKHGRGWINYTHQVPKKIIPFVY